MWKTYFLSLIKKLNNTRNLISLFQKILAYHTREIIYKNNKLLKTLTGKKTTTTSHITLTQKNNTMVIDLIMIGIMAIFSKLTCRDEHQP